jgi:hypothetical protein
MQCTFKKNFEIAKEKGIGLVIQIKKNQGTLYNQIEHGCRRFNPLDRQEDPWEKGHGRVEQRTYEVFDTAEMLKKWPEWGQVKRVIRVERNRERLSERSANEVEVSYYGSNQELSVKNSQNSFGSIGGARIRITTPKILHLMKMEAQNGLGLSIFLY